MSDLTGFRQLHDELETIHRNLKKDSVSRRQDPQRIQRKFKELETLTAEFKELRNNFNRYKHNDIVKEKARDYVEKILTFLNVIRSILDDRLKGCIDLGKNIESDNSISESSVELVETSSKCTKVKMAEKFCLKTAASLLPLMDGSEDVTKRLIDSIELYDTLLDADGKKLLIQYVLKTRLSQNAKVRLNSTYHTSTELILDLKKHFITRKSAVALSTKLNSARQDNKSINEFGKTVEELLTELTIAQADGNSQVLDVLKVTNEKIAINIFASGLRNTELRTIIKARNYETLSDAIRGAVDEQPSSSAENIFHIKRSNQFRGRYNNRSNFGNNRSFVQRTANQNNTNRGAYSRNRENNNLSNNNQSSFRNNNRNNFNNTRRNNYNSRGNSMWTNRGSSNNVPRSDSGAQRMYLTQTREDETNTENDNTFFRSQ